MLVAAVGPNGHVDMYDLPYTERMAGAASRAFDEKHANAVFETYRESIEKQVRAARHLTDFEAVSPLPEVAAKFSAHGLEITVRYPVEPAQAALIDQHMARALRAALDEEPALPLAGAADASPPG